MKDEDKPAAIHIARRLRALGFDDPRDARHGGGARARAHPGEVVQQGERGVARTSSTRSAAGRSPSSSTRRSARKEVRDSYSLRRQTLLANIPYFTTIAAALAACDALEAAQGDPEVRVRSLQEWEEPLTVA